MDGINGIPHLENSLVRPRPEREPPHRRHHEKPKEDEEKPGQEPESPGHIDTTA